MPEKLTHEPGMLGLARPAQLTPLWIGDVEKEVDSWYIIVTKTMPLNKREKKIIQNSILKSGLDEIDLNREEEHIFFLNLHMTVIFEYYMQLLWYQIFKNKTIVDFVSI